ncbi:MAG: penicillin-binding protein 2 [Candidatus Zixiibacteriota bacterium]|nr:MAG: penicillin-binding protein 2 [candidate division Zixibacteria bacterium]
MERFKLSLEGRERVGYAVILIVLVVLASGLVKLQLFEHRGLAIQSENNQIRVVPIIPRRGLVFDRSGNVIIDNRPSYTVSVVPAEEATGRTLANLGELLGMDTTLIRSRINRNMISRYQPASVKRDMSFEKVAILEEQSKRFPGVTYQMEQVRQYPGELGLEVVTGYVGEVSEEELSGLSRPAYRLGSIIGKKGLEKQYDRPLRGREGTAYIEVSAAGQILGEYKERQPVPATPGANVTLTIDSDLQRSCAAALDTFCCGAMVAVDPRNGELLAMTSYPTYDANIFSSVIPESLWQEISSDSTHPLLNRPLMGLYPPGSTVKFIAVGAALESGLITESTALKPCLGGMQFGDRFFRCWNPGGHGSVGPAKALEVSCDVYLYQLGLKLGVDRLSEFYDGCGFSHAPGIDLPIEERGLNPNSEYYDRRYGVRGWTSALVLNNAIGQGELLVTPLQLTTFFCGLANDGIVYLPHVVKRIAYADGRTVSVSPTVSRRLPFSEATLRVLKEGLRRVVEGEQGTARSLRNDLYSIGGKTGTAQNPHGEDHSWFIGVAPLESPEIVVCAIVENAGHGSDVAAPLVGQVIRGYFERKLLDETITVAEDNTEP